MHATVDRGQNSLKVLNPKKTKDEILEAETVVNVTLAQKENGWLVNAESETRFKPGLLTGIKVALFIAAFVFNMPFLAVMAIVFLGIAIVRVGKRGKAIKQELVDCLNLVSNELQSGSIPIDNGGSKKCPSCAELIRAEAVKCRFCGLEMST